MNLRSPRQLPDAERLLADLVRIRKEPDILRDLLGWRGKRIPITGVAADLSDPKHPGTAKRSPASAAASSGPDARAPG